MQSPSDVTDRLRSQLDQVLTDATDALTALVTAVRRGRIDELDMVAQPLGTVSNELAQLEQVA